MRKGGRLQLLCQVLFGNPVELKGEKNQLRGDRRRGFLVGLVKSADRRIGDVAGMNQLGIAHDPRQALIDGFVFADGFAQRGPRQFSDLAEIAFMKGRRCRVGRGKILF